jgi:hypothetical protein
MLSHFLYSWNEKDTFKIYVFTSFVNKVDENAK